MVAFRHSVRVVTACHALLVLSVVAGGCSSPNHRPPAGADQMAVAGNADPAFAVGVVPTMAPPLRVGALVGFRLSSSVSGYGHLYLIAASGDVTRLTENLLLAADAQTDYPRPGDGVQIRASPPAGVDRLILLVTRQPFAGFANNQGELATGPMTLALTAEEFLREFNAATESLPSSAWAVAEERLQVIE